MKKQTNTPSFPGPARPWIGLAAILALAGLFVTLTVTTWLKWGDPVIDTGRELEIPWKIARGELLYRDMVYNYGPFSPYVNAAFIKILGARFTSLAASGLICAALGTVLVVLLTRFFLGLLPGLLLGAAFLFECAFPTLFSQRQLQLRGALRVARGACPVGRTRRAGPHESPLRRGRQRMARRGRASWEAWPSSARSRSPRPCSRPSPRGRWSRGSDRACPSKRRSSTGSPGPRPSSW